MKTTDPPTEASREKQRARAEFIARAVAAALAVRDSSHSLISAIHLALDATEPEQIILVDALTDYQRQLTRMSEVLGARVPPGHVDYLSKASAASWAQAIASEIGQLLGETSAAEKGGGS